MSKDLPRSLGFWSALAIMVGIIIGSGIFRTPTSIAQECGSPLIILLLWVAGGLISLCGGLAFAELGAMFPRSGGIYVYLREGFGPVVAFVFGWTYMLLSKPLAVSGIAIIFAEHMNKLLGVDWDSSIGTCALLTFLTAINVRGVRLGGGVALVLTTLKVAALVAIVALAVALSSGSAANFTPIGSPKPLIWAIVPIMSAILWTYDGWSDVAAVAGEIREPQRNLPRMMLTGTLLMTGLYVAVNAVYFWVLPLDLMRTSTTVAPLVMERLLGESGGVIVTLIALVSTLGSTHGSIITGARITFAQASDRLLFRVLDHVHPRWHTPDISLWVQLALSCIAVCYFKQFGRLVGGFMFTMWIFYGLAAAGVFILRIRRPELNRPYRCWGYPVVPALFVLAAVVMTVLSIVGSLREGHYDTLWWLVILLGGVPVYYVWRIATRDKSGFELRES